MERLEAITGMRGVAALLVVGYHAVLSLWLAQLTLFLEGDATFADQDAFRHPLSAWGLGGGWLGVDFFFVLSGFLLGRPLLRNARDWMGWPRYRVFAAKRFLRIAPPYYASFLVGYALAGWSGHISYRVTAESILVHTVYLHSFIESELLAMNAVYWTLAVELQFYLLLPLLVVPFRRFGAAVAVAFLAIALGYQAWAHTPDDFYRTRFLSFQFPAFLGHFGFGLAAAHLLEKGWRPRIPPDLAIAGALALLLVLPAVLLGYTRQFGPVDTGFYHHLLRPAAALAFAATIFFALQPGSRIGQGFTWRPLVWAGEISYSLYLVHLPFAGVFLVTDPRVVVAMGLPAFAFVVTVGSVAVAVLLYLLVERPSLRLKDHVAGRLEAAAHA